MIQKCLPSPPTSRPANIGTYGIELYMRTVTNLYTFTKVYRFETNDSIPIASMYGISTYIYHKNQPNVGKHTTHGW